MTYRPANNRPVQVLIDRAALRHNLNRVRLLCPQAKVMAVIKADGYGHGMDIAATTLADADEFGVSSLDDVYRLRNAGILQPISLLSAMLSCSEFEKLAALKTRPTIYDVAQIDVLETVSDQADLSIWLKVDTGMGRLGLAVDQVEEALRRLSDIQGITDISLMTHLARADQADHAQNLQQIRQFEQLALQHEYRDLSILNSAGIMGFSDAAYSMVRPGVMLYGISSILGASSAELDLVPAMTLQSSLISVKPMPAGSGIGYGGSYILPEDTRIGVIGCGYGDGYPRHAKNGTPVLLNGVKVPLIGRVSMDMITVDLGKLDARVGDQAILWGADNPIEDVADAAETIAYELSCGILPRVERRII